MGTTAGATGEGRPRAVRGTTGRAASPHRRRWEVFRRALRHEGVAFAAGVVRAFAALGVGLAALRAAGEQLGWGFQLQSPAVVTALAILFFVMALNLSGVFEFGSLVPSGLASWSHANRHVNAFASGLLAVAIASPCTAPFMGAALGYALGERTQVTLGVFVVFSMIAFRNEPLRWNHALAGVLLIGAVWLVFKK